MKDHHAWLLTLLVSLLMLNIFSEADETERQVHIVYLGQRPQGDFSAASHHLGILQQVLSGSSATKSLVYSYGRSFNGFAARLTQHESEKLSGLDGVVSVFPSKNKQLHTTRSWDFMGFSDSANRNLSIENNVVIGVIDTGIWPESKSFSDEGFGPPPIKWKGICQSSANFTCNKKIIGARFYKSDGEIDPEFEDPSPRDTQGHGSHTASTAAGRAVANVSLFGLATGTARGAVPSARIAVYKVCWSKGCSDADILAAFDDAIADGVDVISLSVGSLTVSDYFEDSIAIGSFHAMRSGVLTSNSAGNSGPFPRSVSNVAPWTLTVAATTMDRKIISKVVLEDNETIVGSSINTFKLDGDSIPLIYGGDAPNIAAGFTSDDSSFCRPNSLDSTLVKGKIVFCDGINNGEGALDANALGMIMRFVAFDDFAFSYPLPATLLDMIERGKVLSFMNSSSKPRANILSSEAVKDLNAPEVVSFSSRGPNPITPEILKPDISAPGADILAAWSPVAPMSLFEGDKRSVDYNIISGTSMSCPHASGAAAYVKSFHPTWSPAAIKSALMTTATSVGPLGYGDDDVLSSGSGHINPMKAVDPGLVYDANEVDYITMMCNLGYDTEKLRLVTGDNSSCSNVANGTVLDLNYPSFALHVSSGTPFFANFSRTVTNVGVPTSVYYVSVNSTTALEVSVEPTQLSFEKIGEKKTFIVKVEGSLSWPFQVSTSLVWSDGVHIVRSPIVVYLL